MIRNTGVFVLLFIGYAVADVTEEDGNAYIDKILKSLKDYPELISMPLPDRDIPIFIVPFSNEIAVEFRLRGGELKGLHDVTRINDVVVDGNSDTSTVRAYLDLNAIHINYNTTFINKFLRKEENFNFFAVMDNGHFILDLRINNDKEVYINELSFDKLTGLKVHIDVVGNLFQWIDNAIKSVVVNALVGDLTDLVTDKLRNTFETEISKRPFETA